MSVTDEPEASDVALAVTVDTAAAAAPGVTVIVGRVEVTAAPLIVAPMVRAEPAVVPENVAEYAPLPLDVTALNVPSLVPAPSVKVTVSPLAERLFPDASLTWSVAMSVLPEATLAAETETVDVATEGCGIGGATVLSPPPPQDPIPMTTAREKSAGTTSRSARARKRRKRLGIK